MDNDPVVANCGAGVFGLLACFVIAGGTEENVVRLPGARWVAHVGIRPSDFVDSATLVVETLQAEGVKNLNFVATLQITAAVGPPLTAIVGFERKKELEVQLVISEAVFTVVAFHQQTIRSHLACATITGPEPGVGIFPIK